MVEENSNGTLKAPNSYYVTYLDIGRLLYTIIFFFVDMGFDFYLAYAYFITGKYSYFAWTLAFFLIPAVIITLISIRMYVEDCKNSARKNYTVLRIVLCILGIFLQSALLIRYCDSLRYAIKSFKAELKSDKKQQEKYYNKMSNENSDVTLLRVFECYLESAPQQVLQTTLLIIDYSQGYNVHTTKQLITIALGFVAMGWCMADYHRTIRIDQEDKQNISVLGTVVQFLWHLNFTVSRILAISAIATLYPFWTCIAVASHWCLMTIWIVIFSKTKFCGKNKIFEIFFCGAVGLVYIFNFINLKDGPTKNSYLVFYSLCLIENVVSVAIWGLRSTSVIKNWNYYIFIVFPIVCFILSILFLIVYYKFLHPNKCTSRVKNDNVFYGKTVQKSTCEYRVTLDNDE